MAHANCSETKQGEVYDEAVTRATIQRSFETASPTFFVVEHQRRVIGFLMAEIAGYDYRAGFYTVQKVLYVSPENRGTRAAILLMRELVAWSQRLGAAEIVGGNDNSFRSERTAGFLEHFGFEIVGYAMARKLSEREHGR